MSNGDEKAKLTELQEQLSAAKRDLSNWVSYDMRRSDGSGAQDRRHEETGEGLREDVRTLEQAVKAQQAMVDGLK